MINCTKAFETKAELRREYIDAAYASKLELSLIKLHVDGYRAAVKNVKDVEKLQHIHTIRMLKLKNAIKLDTKECTRYKQSVLASFIEWSGDIDGQDFAVKSAINTLQECFESLSNETYAELADDLRAEIIRQDNEANKIAEVELNIGLEVSARFEDTQEVKQLVEGLLNTAELVYLCKALLDAYEVQSTTAQSSTEKTAVIKFKTAKSAPDVLDLIARLSDVLRQDCIAAKVNGKGHLIGTYAHEWGGKFNPEYFISL